MVTSNIIEACKKSDKIAQKELYENYKSVFYGICRRYIKDAQFAEDAMIASFTKIFLNIKQYSGKGNFEGWMKKIVINECLMFLRRQNKNKNLKSIDIKDYPIHLEDDTNIIADLSSEDIIRLIQALPHGYKTIFNLYIIEGYKHREIAEMLNISIHTSKSQLILAKKRMIELINEHFE